MFAYIFKEEYPTDGWLVYDPVEELTRFVSDTDIPWIIHSVCVCVCAHARACLRGRRCACVGVYVCVGMYVCICVPLCTYVCTWVWVCE